MAFSDVVLQKNGIYFLERNGILSDLSDVFLTRSQGLGGNVRMRVIPRSIFFRRARDKISISRPWKTAVGKIFFERELAVVRATKYYYYFLQLWITLLQHQIHWEGEGEKPGIGIDKKREI